VGAEMAGTEQQRASPLASPTRRRQLLTAFSRESNLILLCAEWIIFLNLEK